jgi:hypothetical protein
MSPWLEEIERPQRRRQDQRTHCGPTFVKVGGRHIEEQPISQRTAEQDKDESRRWMSSPRHTGGSHQRTHPQVQRRGPRRRTAPDPCRQTMPNPSKITRAIRMSLGRLRSACAGKKPNGRHRGIFAIKSPRWIGARQSDTELETARSHRRCYGIEKGRVTRRG